MVKSEQIYSPQNYLVAVTGDCYVVRGDNDIEEIEIILDDYGYCLWNYPLSEIDHIVENNLNVVLVDCMVYDNETNEYKHVYRWFEVPEDFEEDCDTEPETITNTTPCDGGECPYNATCSEDCRYYCGLGVDETEHEDEEE